MTSTELFNKLKPCSIKSIEGYYREGHGLDINYSDIFNKLIKDAARTNRFQSDVYYVLKEIETTLNDYNPENPPEPIWAAYRKDGVDGTGFLFVTYNQEKTYGSLSSRYLQSTRYLFGRKILNMEKDTTQTLMSMLSEVKYETYNMDKRSGLQRLER